VIRNNHVDFIGVQETKNKGTSGGILVGCRDETMIVNNVSLVKYCVSCMVSDKKSGLLWKLVVVYGSPYDEGNIEFINELHSIVGLAQIKAMVGSIKKLADCFNDWVNKWGLIELNPDNRKFT
jgi:hypothetical protein